MKTIFFLFQIVLITFADTRFLQDSDQQIPVCETLPPCNATPPVPVCKVPPPVPVLCNVSETQPIIKEKLQAPKQNLNITVLPEQPQSCQIPVLSTPTPKLTTEPPIQQQTQVIVPKELQIFIQLRPKFGVLEYNKSIPIQNITEFSSSSINQTTENITTKQPILESVHLPVINRTTCYCEQSILEQGSEQPRTQPCNQIKITQPKPQLELQPQPQALPCQLIQEDQQLIESKLQGQEVPVNPSQQTLYVNSTDNRYVFQAKAGSKVTIIQMPNLCIIAVPEGDQLINTTAQPGNISEIKQGSNVNISVEVASDVNNLEIEAQPGAQVSFIMTDFQMTICPKQQPAQCINNNISLEIPKATLKADSLCNIKTCL